MESLLEEGDLLARVIGIASLALEMPTPRERRQCGLRKSTRFNRRKVHRDCTLTRDGG